MEQSIPVSSTEVIQSPRAGAGFALRAGGQIIDLIIHNGISLVVGLTGGFLIIIYADLTGMSLYSMSAKLDAPTPLGYILPAVGYVFYHAICEGMHGATLGKLIFRVHVLKEDGSPAGMGQAFIRSVAFYIDSFLFGLVAAASMRSSELKQRLGDKAGNTVVVERSKFNQYPWPSGWKFVLVFLLAIIVDGSIMALSLLFKLL